MHWLNLFLNMHRPLQFQGKGMSFKVGSLTSDASTKFVKTDLSLLFYREVLNCISYCEVGVDILLHGYGYFCSLHKQFCHGFFWRVAQAQKGKNEGNARAKHNVLSTAFLADAGQCFDPRRGTRIYSRRFDWALVFGTVFFSQTQKVTFSFDERAVC